MGEDKRITIETPVQFRDELPEAVDVAIIGGGVIGVFAALYMARAGLRVFLAEKGRIAGEQSSRNWGWIRQQGRDEAELPIMMKARHLWQEVDREVNGACGVTVGGCYYLATSREVVEEREAWLDVAREHGLDTQALTRGAIEAAFGDHAHPMWIGGIVTPSDMRGEPWRAVPAVARLAQAEGVAIREDCAVRALDVAGGQVQGIVTEAGKVRAGQVIVAAGAWSSLFLRRHGVEIPQLSVRNTVVQTAPLPAFFNGAATDEELAMRRRADGGYSLAQAENETFFLGPDAFRHVRTYLPMLKRNWRSVGLRPLAGKGFPDGWGTARQWREDEETPFEQVRVLDPAPDLGGVERMRRRFAARFPLIGPPEVRDAWAGMIDVMPDIVPIVDRVPGHEGLIVATGMSGHGFGIGPGFGEVLARMVQGKAQDFDLSRFRFARFSDGSPLEVGRAL
ncbi:NAD(P)/FAD-dependent oxidoreductase [Marimonas lutisalis]|uniref:NAD(P)/FAD-dependent oxidoreductase n=1 Tax=Marimonas lutisalis TaxID=2545756 RepID=UPI0010F52516|nr:FAD-binding oxidoreductase [Marimonas lutisalis]